MKKNLIVMTALLLAVSIVLSGCSGILELLGGKDKWQEQYDLGMRYLDDGDYEEAILAFSAAIEIDPDRPEAYMARAEVYMELEKFDDALKDYKRAKRTAKQDDKYDDLLEELEDLIDELEEWIEEWEDRIPDGYDEGGPGEEELPVENGSDSSGGTDWPLEDDWHTDEEHYIDITVADDYVDALINQYDVECCYHIPGIKLPNNRAEAVNREISDYYMGLLRDNESQGYTGNKRAVRYQSIRYMWGVAKDMISVVVAVSSADYDWVEYTAYTVSIKTGKQVSREELLAAWGLNEAGYREMARATLEKNFEGYTDEMVEMIGQDYYRYLVDSTLADDNLASTTPFIGPDGSLCMIAGTYGAAGAGFYWNNFNLETRSRLRWSNCDYPHTWNELPGVYRTPEEITRLTEQWYNNFIAVENGRFSASDQETWEEGNYCYVVIRFQNMDPDYRGEANVLHAVAQVDMVTGDIWENGGYMGRAW
jgi:tetratricopeptide (TPR) repeat protein